VAGTFAAAASVLAAIGALIVRLSEPANPSRVKRLAMVAAMWLGFTALCAGVLRLVFVVAGDGGVSVLLDPWSLWFEMASATSTTGLTMLDDPSLADPWLQWYRSIVQWAGAFGVVLFAVLVAEPSGDSDTLVGASWNDAPGDTAGETARRVGAILVSLSAVAIVALICVGEPVWRAVNHGLTAAATGGFSITPTSAAASGAAAQVVLAMVALVSAVSFGTIWDVVRRTGAPLWRRTQIRFAAAITCGGIVASLLVRDDRPIGTVVFDSISASTTAGFSIASSSPALPAIATITIVSMFVGGAAGSTAGGVKVARVAWLLKAARRWLPGGTTVDDHAAYQWDSLRVDPDDARVRVFGAAALMTTWLLTVCVGVVVLATVNRTVPVGDVVFETVSAGFGVGLSASLTSADNDAITKATLSVLMLAGRVEITAFLVLLIAPVARVERAVSAARTARR
jgi:trk system potassium uptake protein TrkH